MKQVWILNHYAQEPGSPGGTRHFALAKGLVAHGWQASLVAASTEHGTGRERLARGERQRLEVIDGVPYLWLKTQPYAGNGADRVRNMVGYMRAALRRGALTGLAKPDIVIGSSVHPLAALAGARLARRHRVPFVFEVRDLWPETLIDMGRIGRNSPEARALRGLERWLYRRAARIIVLMPMASDYIAPMGIAPERIVWIPNGADLSLFASEPVPPTENGTFTFMYFGAHGPANGLSTVLAAMARLKADEMTAPVRLRLIGDGPMKPALVAEAEALRLTNVSFEDPVPRMGIPALAAEASAFVFNLVDAPVFKYGISSNKLFDFLAAGRPIVFSCRAANNPVAEAGAGLTVAPGDPEALAAAMAALARMPAVERARMGAAGREHVAANYSASTLAARLAATLDDVLSERP